MKKYTSEKYASVHQGKISDLMAIYDDYLYMFREHEQYLWLTSVDELAEAQKNQMYSEGYHFPWKITKLNEAEKQEFADFTANNIRGSGQRSYVNLQHIKKEENNGKRPVFVIPPYTNTTIGMELPSKIERYTISYPKDVTVGETEFYVDGRYKVVYTGGKEKNKRLADCINDQNLLTEITLMLNIGEAFRHNGYVDDDKFEQMVTEAYADEMLLTNENNMLEMIGSFADKAKDICNDMYEDKSNAKDKKNSSRKNVRTAQANGFMNLPANFQDYINIRDFMRHQWDTLDELEAYMPKQRSDSKKLRATRLNSYLKFGGKSYFQRMRAYEIVLHQMQQIIAEINPNRIIRNENESYDEFIERVKSAHHRNPGRHLEAEANYMLLHDEYIGLENDIHAISPDIRIVEDVCESDHKFERMFKRMEDYKKRSMFLETFHTIECYALGHCIRHGKNCTEKGDNLTTPDVWDYLRETGVITPEECTRWQDYTKLRRQLSHSYFNGYLKSRLYEKKADFFQDLHALEKKLYDIGPYVTKKEEGVYQYTHADGKVVVLDHNNHTILSVTDAPQHQVIHKESAKIETTEYQPDRKPYREVYRNGIEFKIDNEEISGVRLPNDTFINIARQSIDFGDRTRWYANSQYFNALQTPRSTVRTDKELKVTGYFEGSRNFDVQNRHNLLIDNRHRLLLDGNCRIKEFDFMNAADKIVKTEFDHIAEGKDMLSFADGTKVVFSGKDVIVAHGGKVLNYDNRKEFVKTYDGTSMPPQQISKHRNTR